jgi:hypothetical protein
MAVDDFRADDILMLGSAPPFIAARHGVDPTCFAVSIFITILIVIKN